MRVLSIPFCTSAYQRNFPAGPQEIISKETGGRREEEGQIKT